MGGSLTVVGTGMRIVGQVTPEARASMEGAEKLLYLESDAATIQWLRSINPSAESLLDCYAEGRPRSETYREMVDRVLAPVRSGLRVCASFYGHPGFFVTPSHAAIRIAREEGYPARMLPAISSMDCLYADLGIDPAVEGCQTFEATDFVLCKRRFDPRNKLILLQIGAVGVTTWKPVPVWSVEGLQVLAEVLMETYPATHEVIVYETYSIPVCPALIAPVPLEDLAAAPVTANSTLYIPPFGQALPDPQRRARLGL